MTLCQPNSTSLRLFTVLAVGASSILMSGVSPAVAAEWDLKLVKSGGLELFPHGGDWGNPNEWDDPNPSDSQVLPGPSDVVKILPVLASGYPSIDLDVPVSVGWVEIGSQSSGQIGADEIDIDADFHTPVGGQVFEVLNELKITADGTEDTVGGLDSFDYGLADVDFHNVIATAGSVLLHRTPINTEGRVTLELFDGGLTALDNIDIEDAGLALHNGAVLASVRGITYIKGEGTLFSGSVGHRIASDVVNRNFVKLADVDGDRVETVVEGSVNGHGDWFLGNRHELILRHDDPEGTSPSLISGDIVGPGRLRIEGEGNVVELTGASSVSDGTIVTDGATFVIPSASRLGTFGDNFLQVGSGGTLRASGNFTVGLPVFSADGQFDTNGYEVVLAGDLTGPSSSVTRKLGEGKLYLGNNASGYSGDWVVEAGELTSGVNADTFSNTTSVTVEASATLRFVDSEELAGIDGEGQIGISVGKQMRIGYDNSDHDFSGQLTGPGDVVKWGSGTQRFSGENSLIGQWILNEGVFRFGSGLSLSGDLEIGAGKQIFFDPESGESDYAHSLSGEGTVFMSGSGTINFTGDNSEFTGTLFITHPTNQGGTLNVEGTIAPSVLGIEANATLGGSGQILGTATALAGGTIRPTAESGHLQVDGVDFRAGSTFGVDIASASEYSTLRVLGDTTTNDAILNVNLLDGFMPAHGDSFLVLDTHGTVSGSGFTSIDLPELANGLSWETSQLQSAGLISIEVTLPGDYNLDGTVDATDYTVWRDNFGQPAGTLPSDIDGGSIGQAHYDTWVAHFGQSLPTSTIAVPEPRALVLMVGFLAATLTAERHLAAR